MKLSFSTLGCPEWSLETIVRNASIMGFNAVDFRGLLKDMDISQRPEFTTELSKTKQLLDKYGVSVSCVSISAWFAVVDSNERKKQFIEARNNMKIASKLGASMVRIFGGQVPEAFTVKTIMPFLVENLQKIGDEAEEYDVTLALETHDNWTDSSVCARLMQKVDHPHVRVLWDLHHPYRLNGEPPEVTYHNLAPYIVNIHIKDSFIDKYKKLQHVLLGEGDIPVKKMLGLLVEGGYDGYATLEWEKRWKPELAEPDVVFPQFVRKMREWLGKSFQI